MILKLCGHDYKYAVEQILFTLFPGEKAEYGEISPDVLSAVVSVSKGSTYTTTSTKIFAPDGGTFRGVSRVANNLLDGKIMTDRLMQRCIKLSFYKAATKCTGKEPVWGALTGIRPGKLVSTIMEQGKTDSYAIRAMEKEYFVSPERAKLCTDTARAGLKVKRMLKDHDICLYVGIPFCPTRCAYCSFVSNSVEKSMKLIEPFLEALFLEIEETAKIVRETGLNIISVYMGGGTPTTLSAPQLHRLMKKLEESFVLPAGIEYTVEAGRPDTITEDKLAVLKDHGVTRISVNPQTMIDEVLEAIGRKHTAADIISALEITRKSGISEINMDLIAGLPADSYEGFCQTLDTVLALDPENITVHTLSLKKGTRITLEHTKIPDGETVGRMLDYAELTLRKAGYVPYYLYRQKFMSGGFENVGWSKAGTDNLYNICIMEELCTIVSLGGGGSTKLVEPRSGKIERIFNYKYPHEYIEGIDKVRNNKWSIKKFYNTEV